MKMKMIQRQKQTTMRLKPPRKHPLHPHLILRPTTKVPHPHRIHQQFTILAFRRLVFSCTYSDNLRDVDNFLVFPAWPGLSGFMRSNDLQCSNGFQRKGF